MSRRPSGETRQSRELPELTIVPRERDLGDGFSVRRVLPQGKRRMVGPLHLLRPDGPGRAARRSWHGRSPASAHRAGHRHLSLRWARHAPGQRRQRVGD